MGRNSRVYIPSCRWLDKRMSMRIHCVADMEASDSLLRRTNLSPSRQTESVTWLCGGQRSFRFTTSTNKSVTQQTNGISEFIVFPWRVSSARSLFTSMVRLRKRKPNLNALLSVMSSWREKERSSVLMRREVSPVSLRSRHRVCKRQRSKEGEEFSLEGAPTAIRGWQSST
jgi:hypothetical protein